MGEYSATFACLFIGIAVIVLALAFRRSPAENAQDTFRNPHRWN